MARFPSELDGSLLDLDLLSLDPESIRAALKGEVGLVQGTRKKTRRNEKSCVDDGDFKDLQVGAGGDSGAKVTQLSWRVLKTTATPPTSPPSNQEAEASNEMRRKSEQLLQGFYMKHGIHFPLSEREPNLFTQQSPGQGTGRESDDKSRQSNRGSGETGTPGKTSFSSSKGSSGGGTAAGGGSEGGGGGRRRPSSRSGSGHSQHSLNMDPSETDVTTGATTTETDVDDDDDEDPQKRKSKGHSLTLPTHQRETGSMLSVLKATPSERVLLTAKGSITSLGAGVKRKLLGGSFENDTHQHPIVKKRRETHPERDPDPGAFSFVITEYGASGKKLGKAHIDLRKSAIIDPFQEKHKKPKQLLGEQIHKENAAAKRKSKVSNVSSVSYTISSPSMSFTFHPEKILLPLTIPVPPPPVKFGSLKRVDHGKKGRRSHFQGGEREPTPLISNSRATARLMERELDSEWMQWSSSEDETKDEEAQEHEAALKKRESDNSRKKRSTYSSRQRPIQPDLQFFLEEISVLERVLSIMGLNPYPKVVRSNQCVQVKWDPKSGEFAGVCCNAIFFVTITLSLLASLAIIAGYQPPQSITHEIIQLEYANHFPESLFLGLLSIFLCVWSVSCVMELGIHYAEFFSRFNMAICLLKYDVTDGLHRLIMYLLTSIGLFNLFMAALFFGGKDTVIVRDTVGFFGFMILRPFNFSLRESIYYPVAEIFGLFVFLYLFLCLNMVLLQIAVYAKAMGNMATKFNLRLAYALGKVSVVGRNGMGFEYQDQVKKIIPFEKLYAEHLIIASLFRHMSQVNKVVFRSLMFSMVCEIVLSIWLLFDLFLDEGHIQREFFIEKSGFVQLAVPLRVGEVAVEAIFKTVLTFFITMMLYWGWGGLMHNAATKLHIGFEYIRRHGLVLTTFSKEKRFILSMIHSFGSKHAYWLGKTFHINRPFLLRMISFVVFSSMVVVAYRPSRSSLTLIEQCSKEGQCYSIKLAKGSLYLFYAMDDAIPPPTPKPTIIFIPLPNDPVINLKFQPNMFLNHPPCASLSSYPAVYSYVCPTNWSLVKNLTLPYLYKPINYFYYPTEKRSTIYGRIQQPFTSSSLEKTIFSSCPDADKPFYRFPYAFDFYLPASGAIVDCFHQEVKQDERDDCGNLPFSTPLSKTFRPPKLQLIAMNQLKEFKNDDDDRFFCCYEYASSSKNEVRVCNLPDPKTIKIRCKLRASTDPSLSKYVDELKGKRKGYDVLASTIPFNDPKRSRWTHCLCNKNQKKCRTPPYHPLCLDRPLIPQQGRLFTTCEVLSQTGMWEALPFTMYPNIITPLERTDFYIQHIGWNGAASCTLNGEKQFPSTTSGDIVPKPPAYDCLERKYDEVFKDDCDTAIILLPGYNPMLRATIWTSPNSPPVVRCCVDYSGPIGSRKRALVCNLPNQEAVTTACMKNNNPIVRSYEKVWRKLTEVIKERFERDENTLLCLCNHLKYFYKVYPTSKIPSDTTHAKYCENYFASFS